MEDTVMDRITEELVTYSTEFSDSVLTEPVKDAAVRHLVDTVACAVAGSELLSATIAAKVARTALNDKGATLIGAGMRVTPDMAAFANTTMVRAWDWNDGMYAKAGGHPSDMIPALLAVGEMAGASPEEFLVAMVLAYEILGALGDATALRWDQGMFMSPAVALAMGKLLGMSKDKLASAVGLAITPNTALPVSRSGRSMWKYSATAASMRGAVFAVTLAKEGMVGSDEPFQSPGGLWEDITNPFEVSLPAKAEGPRVVEMSYMKRYPTVVHAQALVGLAPTIRSWTTAEEIESIDVETYSQACWDLNRSPSIYDPQAREQADQSIPYALAVALVDGGLTRSSYLPERILDPSLRPIMAKIHVHEHRGFTKQFRRQGAEISGSPRFRVTIRTTSGGERVEEVTYHKGHSLNPMSVADINEKLDEACAGIVNDDDKEEIRATWWNIDKAKSIAEPIRTLAKFVN
jgi:2-methylcitrate dehydratase